MAEINTIVTDDLTVKRFIGSLISDEIVSDMQAFYAVNPTKNVLWDLSKASFQQLSSEHIRQFAKIIELRAHLRYGGKTAIYAPDDLQYGYCRMLLSFVEFRDLPIEMRLFRKLNEAIGWFGVDELINLD